MYGTYEPVSLRPLCRECWTWKIRRGREALRLRSSICAHYFRQNFLLSPKAFRSFVRGNHGSALSLSRTPSDGDVTCGLNFFGGLPSSSFFVCSIVPRSISRRYAAARAKTTSASDDRLGRPPPSMLRSLFASRSRHGTPYRLQSRVKQW